VPLSTFLRTLCATDASGTGPGPDVGVPLSTFLRTLCATDAVVTLLRRTVTAGRLLGGRAELAEGRGVEEQQGRHVGSAASATTWSRAQGPGPACFA
jgi:hypothetical protein